MFLQSAKLIQQRTTAMFPFFFLINIKKPAADVSGLFVCASAWSSFIIRCTWVFCSTTLTLLSGTPSLFCFHPAQLPMANFASVLDCKMSLDTQMPRVPLLLKEPFPPPVIRRDALLVCCLCCCCWTESSDYFLAACHILMKHRAL